MPELPRLPRSLLTSAIAIAIAFMLARLASADKPANGNAGGSSPAQGRRAAADPSTVPPSASGPAARPVEPMAERVAPKETISRDAAVALVRQRTGGKVVRADRREDGGKVDYQVRIVTPDGHVRDYRVDAATGQVR